MDENDHDTLFQAMDDNADLMEYTPEPTEYHNDDNNNNEVDVEDGAPELAESRSRQSNRQLHNTEDHKEEEHSDSFEQIHAYNTNTDSPSPSNRRNSRNLNLTQYEALIKQFQTTINELTRDKQELSAENERLKMEKETIQIEADSKFDSLNFEIEQMQIESQQYQIRYQEIHEELNELRGSQMEHQSTGKENQELLIRLQNKEQNEMSLIIELEQANKANETLKNQLKNANQNTAKLQKGLIQLKKDKSVLEKNLQSAMDKFDILKQQSTLELNSLSDRVIQLQRENEIYRQNLSTAEQEKMEMQNNFTEATMELLHDEMNESHGDFKETPTSLRLGRISTSDITRRGSEYGDNQPGTPEPNSPHFGSSTFVKNRFNSQTSLPDQSLLETFAENDADDVYGGHSRKGSLDSRLGGYDVDPIRLKQDIRDILVEDIKTLLSQEVNNLSNMTLHGTPAVNNNPALDELPEKMDKLLEIAKSKGIGMQQPQQASQESTEAKLDEETLNKMMGNFQESMSEILRKDVIENIVSSKNDREQFENKMNETMDNLVQNINDKQQMNDVLKEAISSQMTVLQIALENQIGNTVSDTVMDAIDKKINSSLRENIKQDMNESLVEIKEMISDNMEHKTDINPNETNLDNKQMETMLNSKLEECINNIMNGKIDGFMDEFRKEVVPEVQAVFEQLSLSKTASYLEVDDEKANTNHSELVIMNNKLKQEIEGLKKEKEEHDAVLKSAATSKIHQIVRLQNLLDHMRDDNRRLAYQLEKYREKFEEIREVQDNNVVNKLWGYWNSKPSNNLST